MCRDLYTAIRNNILPDINKYLSHLRLLLSRENLPPIAEIYQHGFIPALKKLLTEQYHSETEILIQTTWCYINLSFSIVPEHVGQLRDTETLDLLLGLINRVKPREVIENVMFITFKEISYRGPSRF